MSYILSHWRGKLSLEMTLWVNVVGLLIVVSYAELFVLSKLATDPAQLFGITLASLFFTRAVIFPWQLMGLFRAIEHDYIEHKNVLKTRGLQGFAVLMVLFTLVYCLEVIQGALYYIKQVEIYSRPGDPVAYQINVSEDRHQLSISGSLDVGITSAVRSTINAHPQIKSVVLQSRGGQIYEGRGLAKVFTEYGFDSYVYDECSSACATAFIGGKQRYLGAEGKLGFHQYRVETTRYSKFVPFYDLGVEQQRDLALFKARGIDQVFLDKMFDQPANRIWFPDHATLRVSRIIHDVISTNSRL